MRGKKTDPVFVSNFIRDCVAMGLDTTPAIVAHAQTQIKEIDDEIQAIEKKKAIRSQLLDVVDAFEKSSKSKAAEAKLLSFFKLRYPERCGEICQMLKHEVKSLPTLIWTDLEHDDIQYKFCIKQLIEAKIIVRIGNQILRGDKFDEYMKFVLHEDA
jgi:hypothetical protein